MNSILMCLAFAAIGLILLTICFVTHLILNFIRRLFGRRVRTFGSELSAVLLQQANGTTPRGSEAYIQVQGSGGSWSTRSTTGTNAQTLSIALDNAQRTNQGRGVRAVDTKTGALLDIRPGVIVPMNDFRQPSSTSSVINTNRTADVIRRNF